MSANAKAFIDLTTPDDLAKAIMTLWTTYKEARGPWEQEVLEIRNFLYATDTKHTQVGDLPFKNSTTVPKLSQIATNLMAAYTAHLFSDPDWAQWEAHDKDAAKKKQRKTVEAYTRDKVRRKKYVEVFKKCLVDWINAGCCYAMQTYVTEMGEHPDGTPKVLYQGPKLERISPMDIAWDVTATDFKSAAKVIRRTYTLGDIVKDVMENSESYFTMEMVEEIRMTRHGLRQAVKGPEGIDYKGIGLTKDGFGDLMNYMQGDLIEVHEFYGTLYDMETGEFRHNHKVVVLDRRKVIYDQPISSENGSQRIYYDGWELRPDNLMGMSPLARIVGLQYKVDKLENLRADVFDQMANPATVEKGLVQFYGKRGAPGAKYVIDDAEGDVRYLTLPTEVLGADFQIDNTMNIMEQMAGSPQNASGFRTPGEKTKFEVQVLDQGANRIFRNKTEQYEANFVEEILEDVVALGRENLGDVDVVSTIGGDLKAQEFINVRRDDLFVSGKMRARGSKLFAEKANALQNIMNIIGTPAGQLINPHVSRKQLAAAIEQLADLGEFGIIIPNIGIQEDIESKQLAEKEMARTEDAAVINAEDEALANEQAENLQ